jgi:MYXO-CTERM domain-containing protein
MPALLTVLGVCGGGVARADGAFPDSLSLLLPTDKPNRIALATNFGVVSSDDDGATWLWTCEGATTSSALLYNQSAAPADRLMALSEDDLVLSDDDACTWRVAGGAVGAGSVIDVFPFPQDSSRVLAVVSPNGVGPQTTYTVVESDDGGDTFTSVVYTADANDVITGVEVARSDPKTIYVTIAAGDAFLPKLARSTNGGSVWHVVDLSPTLARAGIRLVAVDHTNAARAYLRVGAAAGEQLGVYDATDDSVKLPVTFTNGLMTAFVQLDEGPLLVGGRVNSDNGAYYRSNDGGATFGAVAGAPHLRALAARAGKVYGAADNTADGFAIGLSTDLGLTFQPLMSFADIVAIKSCVRASCQAICLVQAASKLWPATMCSASPETAETSGCACGVSRGRASKGAFASLVLIVVGARRRRRRSQTFI